MEICKNIYQYYFNSNGVKNVFMQIASTDIVPNNAFYNCKSLTSVVIPDTIIKIDYSAFLGCSGLTSVVIGNSVTSMDFGAFDGCSSLTSVVWNAINYPDFSSSSENPFYSAHTGTTLITSFEFGNRVKHIPAYMCYEMFNLTSITIPDSVTSIGRNAFSRCSGLISVILNPITPPSLGLDAFKSTINSNLTIYVPDSSVDTYKTAPNWSSYADKIKPISQKPA